MSDHDETERGAAFRTEDGSLFYIDRRHLESFKVAPDEARYLDERFGVGEPVSGDRRLSGEVSTPACDIYIVGLGLMGSWQVTRQVEIALRSCRKVLYQHPLPSVGSYLEALGVESEDLAALFQPGESRMAIYRRISDRVVAEAARPIVAFASYGHPTFLVAASRLICQRAGELGLRVRTLAGISALDCLSIDLEFDPIERGLVQFEATYALLHQPVLDPTIPCLLWQVGILENMYVPTAHQEPARFDRLRRYLTRFYPAGHRVALAVSPMQPLATKEIVWVTIDELPAACQSITPMTTLYIPPTSPPEVRDEELAQELQAARSCS